MCLCVYYYDDPVQLMMPVFWASEEGSLTESLANEFKKKVYAAKYGIEAAVWGGVGLGGMSCDCHVVLKEFFIIMCTIVELKCPWF